MLSAPYSSLGMLILLSTVVWVINGNSTVPPLPQNVTFYTCESTGCTQCTPVPPNPNATTLDGCTVLDGHSSWTFCDAGEVISETFENTYCDGPPASTSVVQAGKCMVSGSSSSYAQCSDVQPPPLPPADTPIMYARCKGPNCTDCLEMELNTTADGCEVHQAHSSRKYCSGDSVMEDMFPNLNCSGTPDATSSTPADVCFGGDFYWHCNGLHTPSPPSVSPDPTTTALTSNVSPTGPASSTTPSDTNSMDTTSQSPGPTGVTVAPTTAPRSINGLSVVALDHTMKWSSVRSNLRLLICGVTAHLSSDNSDCLGLEDGLDFYLLGELDVIDVVADRFVVSCNQSWMLYQGLSIPHEALLEVFDGAVSITAAETVTTLPERGPNQLALATVYTGSYTQPWYPFVKMRNDLMTYLYGVESVNMMDLVNGSCDTVPKSATSKYFYYNCTWIVSMKEVSQQVEIAAINWKVFNDERVHYPNYVTAQSLYPSEVDLDATTANAMTNRVEFQFVHIRIHKKYETFYNFAKAIVDTMNGQANASPSGRSFATLEDSSTRSLTVADLHLVRSATALTTTGFVAQNFTVSFPTATTQEKVVQMMATHDSLPTSLQGTVKMYSAAIVASPTHHTDSPDGQQPAKQDHGSNRSTVVIVIVVISVLVVGIVIVFAAKFSKDKNVGGPRSDVEEEMLEPALTVV